MTGSCSWDITVPDAILDPSAALFANSTMLFGLAVLIFYWIAHPGSDLQDYILVFGAVGGFLVTGVIAVMEGAASAIKDYMPIFMIASLLASTCGHWFFNTYSKDNSRQL